jgi:hypothetical protein
MTTGSEASPLGRWPVHWRAMRAPLLLRPSPFPVVARSSHGGDRRRCKLPQALIRPRNAKGKKRCPLGVLPRQPSLTGTFI